MVLTATACSVFGLLGAVSQAVPVVNREATYNDPFAILDPQNWQNPDDMTWDDYVHPPTTSWSSPNRTGSLRNFNIALVCVDFPDLDFTVTQQPNSTFWQNPSPVPGSYGLSRAEVPSYYRDLLNKPEDVNRGHTLHEYWMEDSGGRYGVDLTTFGAYRLPVKSFQYGLDDEEGGFNEGTCPEKPCGVDLRTDALGAWRRDVGNDTADAYELAFILVAGQDESSTWQEFGEMNFTQNNVPDAFGPPGNSSLPNWAPTRYVPWTSFASAASIWPNAGGGSSTQAESSGAATFAHELSHLLGIGDNYNNPYSVPARRSYTGPWSMMSRGSFNGPGGPHSRWHIPALEGGSLGSEHTVRDKLQLGLMDNSSLLSVSRDTLAASGILVAEITARAVQEGPDGLKGVRIEMGTDLSPPCNTTLDPLCDGGNFTDYYLEVIDRMGADSFTPDSGVMISKGKELGRPTQPFQWTIDANPQDVNVVDFYFPNRTASYYTIGDYRQLADALFHAGTRSGSEFEYEDEANGLHFYILDLKRDDSGVLRYTIGVRSLDGSGPSTAGVGLSHGKASKGSTLSGGIECAFELFNTGDYATGNSTIKSQYLKSDIYRLEAEVHGDGWEIAVPNALAAVGFGESSMVNAAVKASKNGTSYAAVKLTATSESDPCVSMSQWCKVKKC